MVCKTMDGSSVGGVQTKRPGLKLVVSEPPSVSIQRPDLALEQWKWCLDLSHARYRARAIPTTWHDFTKWWGLRGLGISLPTHHRCAALDRDDGHRAPGRREVRRAHAGAPALHR
jgi:hypothetical protein